MITKYFGKIPPEWQLVELQKVLHSFQNGYAFSATGYQEEGIPIVTMASIGLDGNFTLNLESAKKWNEGELQKLGQYVLQDGDLIIAMTDVTPEKNLIGRMTIVNKTGPFFLNQRVGLLKIDKSKIDAYFLKSFSNYKWWRDYSRATSTAGVQANISTIDIKRAPIPLPSLDEQKKIAQILSTWDEAIEAVEKLITTKKQLKKSILQKAFSNNLPQKKLSELSIGIYDGTHTTPKYTNEGIPFLSVENITARNFSNTKFISLKEHEQLVKRCSPKQGDILMTRIGSIGDTAYVDWDFEFSIYVSLALIKPDESKINSKYLYQYTKTSIFKKEILKRSLLSAIPQKINLGDISSILVPIMPDEKQVFLAEQLETLDDQIELLSQKKALLQKQKKGLMQQLLTGKTRVS